MIPKFYRCGDPSKKCPLSVSGEIIKDGPKVVCPCANSDCINYREPVSLIEGLTGGKVWIAYAAAVLLAVTLISFLLLGSGDPCNEQLKNHQARLVEFEKELAAIESRTQPADIDASGAKSAASSVETDARKLVELANEAIRNQNESAITGLRSDLQKRIQSATVLAQSLGKPESGAGVNNADAKSLITRLVPMEEEIEEQLEITRDRCPKHITQFEDLSSSVTNLLSRARRLTSPPLSSPLANDGLKDSIQSSISTLVAILARLDSFVPPKKKEAPPFPRQEADVVIAADPELAAHLVGPLAAEWSASKIISGPDGSIYISGGPQKNIIIVPCSDAEGFQLLAGGEISLYFASRPPTAQELSNFGEGFRESRSVAEVVALDALTLLVHPDNPLDIFEIGKAGSSPFFAASKDSVTRNIAERFGLRSQSSGITSGEEMALGDKSMLALGLYHREGMNLRAKRLAVKASADSPGLKPSPFTIATEEYLFSYRIVAWTAAKPNDQALSFVKYITSNPGQAVVERCGFVDLRLKPIPGEVAPEILAALGAALGVDTIGSAQRLSANIRFAVANAQLDLKAQADLERITREAASSYPTHKIVILGYTDSDGGPAINQPLSVRRAEAVASQLRLSKVDSRAGGLGDAFPIDSNKTDTGKARNRRAEVWVVKP